MAAKKRHLCCQETVKPVRDALDVISGKWKLLIVISIAAGNERFTDIQGSIACIPPVVLAKQLREVVQDQVMQRAVLSEEAVEMLYETAPYGDTLTPVVGALQDWGL